MKSFLTRHASEVKGALSGFDRVRFRGTIRWLAHHRGLSTWLGSNGILNKDFPDYATGLTNQIKLATQELAEKAECPLQYLYSSSVRKETVARVIAQGRETRPGLVCVLSAVEPCVTFKVGPNRETKKLELRTHEGKCLHFYFYLIDRHFGWLNVRLQTWFPFTVQIVLNGREWLAQQLLHKGIGFERRDNCFVDIADLPRAQRMMNWQLRSNWPRSLNRILRWVHPAHRRMFGKRPLDYYWSADETEFATDVMFRSPQQLATLYPKLVQHAMTAFGCSDVLRFLGKSPHVQCYDKGEILSHLGTRPEGVRVKHSLDRNSVKMYDKQDWILRVETTINNPRQMKVYRTRENDPDGPKSWQKLRKGVADLHRRAKISRNANERYLNALSAVDTPGTFGEAIAPVCQRQRCWSGRSVRALNPLASNDAPLLEAVSRGEFLINGFRNRDLRKILFGTDASAESARSQMAKVTRMVRMLRAHGLVQKIAKTHRYTVSAKGTEIITAVLAARRASTDQLLSTAA